MGWKTVPRTEPAESCMPRFMKETENKMEKIHMIGYDAVHPESFVYDMPPGHGDWLLILTHTPAFFEIRGEKKILPPHQAALFSPESAIRYGAAGGAYGNDWAIFSSDETSVTHFPLIGEPFFVSDAEYCHQLFRLLTWEFRQGNYETVVSQLLSVLFHKLENEIRRPDAEPWAQELNALRRRVMMHPQRDWTIAGMADELHLSAGYLQLLYKNRFGSSCMEDVIQSRIRLARDYLTHTQMSIAEIAGQCGYHSPEHFNRQFRRLVGISPGKYREAGGAAQEPDSGAAFPGASPSGKNMI